MKRVLVVLVSVVMLSACGGKGPVTEAELPGVIRKLEKGSASARARAEERLSQTSAQVCWPELLQLMDRRSAGPEPRTAAIRIVSKTHGRLGLPAHVVRAAADEDAAVRHEAIRALVEYADPDHRLAIGDLIAGTTDPAVKADLEKALVDHGARAREWYRRRLVTGPDAVERAMAARWLAAVGKEEDIPLLVSVFENGDKLLRQEVLIALSEIGGAEAKAFVRLQLDSTDGYARGVAAFASSRLKDPEAIPGLEKRIAEDMVGDIRVSSATALGDIGGEIGLAALQRSCKLGQPDVRVDDACAASRAKIAAAGKGVSKTP